MKKNDRVMIIATITILDERGNRHAAERKLTGVPLVLAMQIMSEAVFALDQFEFPYGTESSQTNDVEGRCANAFEGEH